mgnify:CR=1 FL=1
MNGDRKIKEKLQPKTWNEIKTNDSWAIFKIMAEFVEGYEKLSKIGPCVSIFGSARTQPEDPYYTLAEEIAFKLHDFGYRGVSSLETAAYGAAAHLIKPEDKVIIVAYCSIDNEKAPTHQPTIVHVDSNNKRVN